MTPHRYTELFFLDEAAAFSAGHRPCAECRRADYNRFRGLWERRFGKPAMADDMDDVLDAERRDGKRKRTHNAEVAALPDGAFVSQGGSAWLVWEDALFAWSDSGYDKRVDRPKRADVEVLTPPSIVEMFRAGYRPAVHPTALVQ